MRVRTRDVARHSSPLFASFVWRPFGEDQNVHGVLGDFVGHAAVFVVGITFLGFALYAIRPVTQAWMMDLAPEEHGASAASVMFAMQSAWTPVVVLLSGLIADEFGLIYVFYLIAASMLCANIVAYFLPGEKRAS